MWEAKSTHQLNLTPNKEPMGKLQPGLSLASHGLELCLGTTPPFNRGWEMEFSAEHRSTSNKHRVVLGKHKCRSQT